MRHLTQRDLLAFLRGELSDSDAGNTMGHLAYCEPCSDRVDALKVLLQAPVGAMEALEGRWREAQAVSNAIADPGQSFDFAVRGWLDPIRKVASVGLNAVANICSPHAFSTSLSAPIAGIGDPALDDVSQDQEQASRALDAGRTEEMQVALERATSRIPGVVSLAEVVLKQEGHEIGRIVIHADRRTVGVLVLESFIPRIIQAPFRPFAVLLTEDERLLQEAILEPIEGSNYWIAEFVNAPTEPFVVALRLHGTPPQN